MVDRSPSSGIEARLHDYLAGELRRAELDYPRLPRRSTTRLTSSRPVGLALGAVALLAALVLLRPFTPAPNSVGGPRLGSDGLPLAIGGEPVLRGDAITARLQAGGTDLYFLAGGRLVLRIVPCLIPSPAPGQASDQCPQEWWLEDVSGSEPSFRLVSAAGGASFVRTSGALTVFRVSPAADVTRCGGICEGELLVEDVLWRQPTKGPIPPDAAPPQGGAINEALVPDFVSAYGQDGLTIAGYIPKELLLHSGSQPGTPENPPLEQPLPVYGEDLTTLVGHMVPGVGFVPLNSP